MTVNYANNRRRHGSFLFQRPSGPTQTLTQPTYSTSYASITSSTMLNSIIGSLSYSTRTAFPSTYHYKLKKEYQKWRIILFINYLRASSLPSTSFLSFRKMGECGLIKILCWWIASIVLSTSTWTRILLLKVQINQNLWHFLITKMGKLLFLHKIPMRTWNSWWSPR